jgi:hypothetical protein
MADSQSAGAHPSQVARSVSGYPLSAIRYPLLSCVILSQRCQRSDWIMVQL